MVLTTRTHTTLFASAAGTTSASPSVLTLIRLPLSIVPQYEHRCQVTGAIVPTVNKPLFRTNLWSSDEHERFLHGLEMFPTGPWKEVAKVVGTKTTRQTMTHAQKYRQKIERRLQAKPKTVAKTVRRQPEHAPVGFYSDTQNFLNTELQTPATGETVASPTDVYDDGVGTLNFLDQEFDAMLKSFDVQLHHSEAFASYSFVDELGMCRV